MNPTFISYFTVELLKYHRRKFLPADALFGNPDQSLRAFDQTLFWDTRVQPLPQ